MDSIVAASDFCHEAKKETADECKAHLQTIVAARATFIGDVGVMKSYCLTMILRRAIQTDTEYALRVMSKEMCEEIMAFDFVGLLQNVCIEPKYDVLRWMASNGLLKKGRADGTWKTPVYRRPAIYNTLGYAVGIRDWRMAEILLTGGVDPDGDGDALLNDRDAITPLDIAVMGLKDIDAPPTSHREMRSWVVFLWKHGSRRTRAVYWMDDVDNAAMDDPPGFHQALRDIIIATNQPDMDIREFDAEVRRIRCENRSPKASAVMASAPKGTPPKKRAPKAIKKQRKASKAPKKVKK